VPADVAAIVYPPQLEPFRIRKLWQLARQTDRAGDVETCWLRSIRETIWQRIK
jgi:hypothetical protein